MPQFSVIIPAFNCLAFLPQTLKSVWSQHCTDYEVIAIDDGSTDGTFDYLKSLGPKIRVLRQENRGPGAARNVGAKVAAGEYLAFLDSDDLWFPWTLNIFARLIREHNSPAILSACMQEFQEESELVEACETPPVAGVYSDYLAASRDGYYTGSGMAVLARDCFIQAGGFSHKRINAEDHDLILRMGIMPGFVQVLRPLTLGRRRRSDSMGMHWRRTFAGMHYLVKQERSGAYPGGEARALERRNIIARHIRPAALACAKQGMGREAWSLYRASFAWQAANGRWKFLSAFPAKLVVRLALGPRV